jgi:DNA-binding Xre family transcriptional regulator
MIKKVTTTFDKWMADPEIKEHFDKGYRNFVLSELILALMENDRKSVRELAKEAGLSPTVIQNLRSGKQQDIKVKNFVSIAHACGYHLFLANEQEKILVG